MEAHFSSLCQGKNPDQLLYSVNMTPPPQLADCRKIANADLLDFHLAGNAALGRIRAINHSGWKGITPTDTCIGAVTPTHAGPHCS